ncbi:hypothetical protein ACSS6W_006991 [Trichoderma asperelloides]
MDGYMLTAAKLLNLDRTPSITHHEAFQQKPEKALWICSSFGTLHPASQSRPPISTSPPADAAICGQLDPVHAHHEQRGGSALCPNEKCPETPQASPQSSSDLGATAPAVRLPLRILVAAGYLCLGQLSDNCCSALTCATVPPHCAAPPPTPNSSLVCCQCNSLH